MKKNLSHRIIAIVIALLMMISSTGFSMDIHYCQDKLISISLIGTAKSCHDLEIPKSCHKKMMTCLKKKDCTIKEKKDDCCHNEKIVVESLDTDALNPHVVITKDLNLDFVNAFVTVFLCNIEIDKEVFRYSYYIPPIPNKDFQVRLQTFLI